MDEHPKRTRGVLAQAFSLAARRMATSIENHYQKHYERFYRRWKKATTAEDDENAFFLDPDEVGDLRVLIKAAWKMRRELENKDDRGFALFPEPKMNMSYVTLDATCLVRLYKQLERKGCQDFDGKMITDGDLSILHCERVFASLFCLRGIRKLAQNKHFRFSFQTDGYGVSWSFGRFHHYKKQTPGQKRKKAKISVSVTSLVPGRAYSYQNKTLEKLINLKGTTVRAVDPGVRRTYTSVDLLTGCRDVRTTKKSMTSRAWYRRTKIQQVGKQMHRWRENELGDVQAVLNRTPFRTSSHRSKYQLYARNVLLHWRELWNWSRQRKIRKLRFRARLLQQREMDREVNVLCTPRKGDTRVLLVYGNGASTNLFGRTKKNVKGPAKGLFEAVGRRKAAVTVWADEFRTSRLDLYGRPIVHPQEKRVQNLQSRTCRCNDHGPESPGCVCFCRHRGCASRRTVREFCHRHKKRVLQHDVCYHNHETHGHRMWNRDVAAALNIGCRFLAMCLGLELKGNVRREVGKNEIDPKTKLSWAAMFGEEIHQVFALPAASPD